MAIVVVSISVAEFYMIALARQSRQNFVAVTDRVAVSMGQPCFDDQPHGFSHRCDIDQRTRHETGAARKA
jgi:hypothetical protein